MINRLLATRRKSPEKDSSENSSIRSRTPSLPPLGGLNINGYKSTTKHRLLNEELASNIRNLLPPRLQLFDDWDLVYCFEQDGISLNTLYRNCNPEFQLQQFKKQKVEKGYGDSVVKSMVIGSQRETKRPQGYVLVIEDEKRNKFGCYINENLRPVDSKRYYGNGECFLWKVEKVSKRETDSLRETPESHHIRFKAFMYTGINDNIIFSNHDSISIGSSGGKNGLWIDKSLYKGVSYRCDTFGNEILNTAHANPDQRIGNFKIMNLEIWRVGSLV